MKTDILMMEKRAVFDIALKLIKKGTFQSTPLTEIAFLSKMSASMMLVIFNSREALLKSLSETVTSDIRKIIADTANKGIDAKGRFFDVWMGLYKHYTKNPDVIAFLEQSEMIGEATSQSPISLPGISKPLLELFSTEIGQENHAETLAVIFHSNVLSAAKMKSCRNPENVVFNPELYLQLLWNGIRYSITRESELAHA